MKKLFFVISIFFLSITSSFAVFFVEAQGDYISLGEFDPVSGGAAGLGFSFTDDLNFLIKFSTASNTEKEGEIDELKIKYTSLTGGIEYIPPIAELEAYRIYWKNSLNVGASIIEGEQPELDGGEHTEDGYILSFWTGLQFNLTQTISPYFSLGYQKSFYSSGADLSVKGWQAAFGVRFYICGSRDYEAGYE